MNAKGRQRGRAATVVAPRAFAWDRALLATLEHSSLPWNESVQATPLTAFTGGARDRLSLLGQFAAHQALLQFAGVADGELDPAEWAVVPKRGGDVRLIRVAARGCDSSLAPPVLTLAQDLARLLGVELDVLRQSWARADAIYAETFARVSRDVAADLQWLRASAAGAIAAPGPEGLRTLANDAGCYGFGDERCPESVLRFAELEGAFAPTVLRGASPLERLSALGGLVDDATLGSAAAADRLLAATSEGRPLFVVLNESAFDEASREVVEILVRARHGTWLRPGEANGLPATRWFVVAPRLAAREALRGPHDAFVQSPGFAAYLAHGEVPEPHAFLPAFAEPARSYLGALALLGTSIPRTLAMRFLERFFFRGALEELAADGVSRVDEETFSFAGEAVRAEAARSIPAASRAAICRVAAAEAEGVRAALLWLDAGEPARATDALAATEFGDANELVDAFHRVPPSVLTPELASRYAHALIDCGRYRDAREVAPTDELVLARAERRMGDYSTALERLTRMEPSFDVLLLRAEVLRLLGREEDAKTLLAQCVPCTEDERIRLDYERGPLGADVTLPPGHYLTSRVQTFRAIQQGAFEEGSRHARDAHRRARNLTERVDASLDRVFAAFTGGAWDDARVLALEALQEVEETQGDRAAGGILFTLAYLAADNAQWAHAAQRIARLRQFYTSTDDALRLDELQLLTAHLDFSRGRFADARRGAEAAWNRLTHHAQVREAAALILDELDLLDGKPRTRATGCSGNAELTRRASGQPPSGSIPRELASFRAAITAGDATTARALAHKYDLHYDPAPAPADFELRVLRTAASRDFPFAPHDFDLPWCFATRNRLGQWTPIGSYTPSPGLLEDGEAVDWIACSERERLYFEGSSRWTADGRHAVAAIFRTRAENHRLRRILEQEEHVRTPVTGAIDGIVGNCAQVRELASLVARIARRDVPACILGESGTGKELVARAIHRQSSRRQKPFTAVNCAALPENLIESELFGHVRGAFTGADRDRPGLIETTDGGTLFLDEIGELPLPAQAKLLRFLQEGEFRRVGDTANRSADVRIVSATNRRLASAVEEGRFRDDLYYRVRGVELALPPLRERGADILLLAQHFLAAEREKHQSGPASLSPDVEAIFTAYPWPGNVRELQNSIRAAHAMAGESKTLDLEHLPERLRNVVPSRTVAGSYHDAVCRFKRDLIERSLLEARGNQNRAAALLKMSRQALAYQIRELGILVRDVVRG